ncbi:MAG: alpha/beta fold hydrolase, partial [Bacteroides cellulosilyticus]|nr:alpha/beta fold hydrolase [Bacteroides cellulosilyticus]
KDSVLTIQIPNIHASYKGKLGADNKIYGNFTQGIQLKLDLEKGESAKINRPQEPQPPFLYKVEDITIENPQAGITLAGTLTLPEQGSKFPAVVLVTGSGPQNRDEEIMGHKPFLVIADYLTRNGIAVLRCDDRGVGESKGVYASATNEDFTSDAEAAFQYLKSRKEINSKQIGVIGHSCGGTVAFMLAARNKEVAFIVSLAGATIQGNSLMLKQSEMIFKSNGMPDAAWELTKPMLRTRYALLTQNKSAEEIRKELYANVVQTLSPGQLQDINVMKKAEAQINSMTSPWYLHFMRYGPTSDLKKTQCPILALNGEKDLQVDADMNLGAVEQWVKSNGNKQVTTKEYPGLNHLFQVCKTCTINEYGQLEETISPEVLKDMSDWILKLKKK